MVFLRIALLVVAFTAIWLGSGWVVAAVNKLSNRFHVSSFTFSFFILGLLTSVPELALGVNAIINHQPDLFVGNLLGGIVVIFLLITPLLAIVGRGVSLSRDLDNRKLLITFAILLLPALFLLDGKLTNAGGILLVVSYYLLYIVIRTRMSWWKRLRNILGALRRPKFIFRDSIRLAAGIILIFLASHVVVDQSVYLSTSFQIPALLVGLLGLSIGTNMPELALGVRAVVSGHKAVAFGDYLGSAATNVLLLGTLTIFNDGEVVTGVSFWPILLFTGLGLALFYRLMTHDGTLSRREGWLLLGLYAVFVLFEVL